MEYKKKYKKITKEELLKAVRKELEIEETKCLREFLEETKFETEKEFVKKAYRWVLKRKADPEGLLYYLELLKNGKASRAEVVLALHLSEEGQEKKVKIKEVEEVFEKIKSLRRLVRNRAIRWALTKWIKWKVEKKGEKLQGKKEPEQGLKGEFNEVEEVLFMERFRGKREEVKELLRRVLPLVREVISGFEGEEVKAVDLGCGRGEWLELLREEGIFCEGVELNSVLARELEEKGFCVWKREALEFLKSCEDGSYHIVSGFHLIEHLPVGRRTKFLKEVYRVLKKGGIALFETPNPRNILVGAGDFYRDPSHLVPVFPDTLEFMGEVAGFEESVAFFYEEEGLVPAREVRFDRLEDYLSVSRDYLWVGRKL